MTPSRLVPALASLFLIPLVAPVGAQEEREVEAVKPVPQSFGRPTELVLRRGASTTRDLRTLPQVPVRKRERPEREGPEPEPVELPGAPRPSAPIEVPGP